MSKAEEAPDKELNANAAASHFKGMAEYWNLVAANTYNEWAGMKYVKPKDGRGHKSKNAFLDYKRMVYDRHKHFRLRADLCEAVAKMLTDGDESIDLNDIKADGAIKSAGKIIMGNFNRLKP